MPHVDELLGPATFAAAGLVVAIALQPPVATTAPASRPATTAASAARPGTVVRLPSVEVVALRSTALAVLERDAGARGAAKPRA